MGIVSDRKYLWEVFTPTKNTSVASSKKSKNFYKNIFWICTRCSTLFSFTSQVSVVWDSKEKRTRIWRQRKRWCASSFHFPFIYGKKKLLLLKGKNKLIYVMIGDKKKTICYWDFKFSMANFAVVLILDAFFFFWLKDGGPFSALAQLGSGHLSCSIIATTLRSVGPVDDHFLN